MQHRPASLNASPSVVAGRLDASKWNIRNTQMIQKPKMQLLKLRIVKNSNKIKNPVIESNKIIFQYSKMIKFVRIEDASFNY